jgi:uncharacterized protein (UPF0333 family)
VVLTTICCGKSLRLFKETIIMDNRAQISVEMIIVMAAMIALGLFLLTNLNNTATKAGDTLTKKSTELLNQINRIK